MRATAALGVLAARDGDLELAVGRLEQARQADSEAFFALPSAVPTAIDAASATTPAANTQRVNLTCPSHLS